MPSDTRSPQDIERDVERHRSDLSDSLREIQSRFTPEAVVREVTQAFRSHGSEMGTAVTRSVQQNPVALAVTGIGLAWLIFGRSHDDRPAAPAAYDPLQDGVDRPDPRALYGTPPVHPATTGRDPSYPAWLDAADRYDGGTSDEESTRAKAARGMSQAGHDVAHRASQMRDRLYHGTEHLGDAARQRIASARHAAVTARDRAAPVLRDNWRAGRDNASRFLEEQPLVAGALAIAVGAALASALPSTRTEDALMGEESDRLVHEAERIFEEEREKAKQVGKAALDEAGKIADEKRGDAADAARTLSDETRDAAARVRGAAEEEADRQKLTSREG